MKIGVIGIPGRWSSERLADAFEIRTGFRLLVDMKDFVEDLATGSLSVEGRDIRKLDALVVKKISLDYSHDMLDRLEILKHLDKSGLRIFSNPVAIAKAVNRLSGTLELSNNKIPIPDTVITENIDKAAEAVRNFGKAILKPLFTSKARGMVLIEDGPQTAERIAEFKRHNPTIYVQKAVEITGRDFGVVFLGGKYLAAYARVAKDKSWNTTTANGGRYQLHEPSAEIIELARRAQAPFGLDFTCVDIAQTPDGPVVFEVSAFGGFRGLKEANNIDAASLYADHVLRKLDDG